jgi:Spy/CpxP family protein refolding chaperone
MKRISIYLLLTLSLLLNVGVVAAVGYHFLGDRGGAHGDGYLADYLGLTPEQRSMWREREENFMHDLGSAWSEIKSRRERMIREIFSDRPDTAVIEAERAAIARLQEEQQRQVIRQLMAEREMLEPRQRQALAELLIEQEPAGTLEEHLHRR